METERDLYRVCIPFTLGVFSAAQLFKAVGNMSGICYAIASIIALTTFGAAGFSGTLILRKDKPRTTPSPAVRSPLLWLGLFLILGLFCYSTRAIMLPTIPVGSYFIRLRDSLFDIIEALPFSDTENNALVKALILADRSGLSRSTTASFRTAGAAHLLALSGMHLGIIYLIVKKMLFFLGNTVQARQSRSALVIIITGLYTLLCGSGASLVRAWLFILLHEGGKMLGRSQRPQDVLCAALTIHLIIKPESIMSVGFQLSYLAMVGIVFIWPHVRTWMNGKIWAAVSLSLCCQLFTAPLTLYYFGTFPKYFLITNLFVAPLTGIIMGCSLIGIAISAFFPELWEMDVLAPILEAPLSVMRWLLDGICQLP